MASKQKGYGTAYAEFLASKIPHDAPTGFDPGKLNRRLFDFQVALVRWACLRGRAAIFADTGLGKTFMQLEWAHKVVEHTDGVVLILAPLCVAVQTRAEAEKLDIDCTVVRNADGLGKRGVFITNYEMLERFDLHSLSGLVLDESSILKSIDGKTRAFLLEHAQVVPYRLSCTATPSPNDYMEFGGQSEFLGVMDHSEMLSMFFTHDGGNTSNWRLKGHGRVRFWEWLSHWAAYVRKPEDLGFEGSRFVLPELNIDVRKLDVGIPKPRRFFVEEAETLQERISARKETVSARVAEAARIVKAEPRESWLVWCHLNAESDALERAISGAVAVSGSHPLEEKERRILAFTRGESRVLITKPSIAGFGMNWQHCSRMVFVGLNDSYEEFYQALRRCWRFGQTEQVHAYVIATDIEGAVLANIQRKEQQANDMAIEMAEHMIDLVKREVSGTRREKIKYGRAEQLGKGWRMQLGDCVECVREIEGGSVGYTLFSPPFPSLYTYSNSERDMGNCGSNAEFDAHFRFLVPELFRVTMPGRHVSFHCMNIPTLKMRDGVIGLRDFRGDLIRMFQGAGFIYHSEVCIWKDPVTAMQRTKAFGLLHKTIRKDSSMARMGLPDYIVTMRKPGENPKLIPHNHANFPVSQWQEWASPIWMNIRPGRTLNRDGAREDADERHIAPLQLDVVERCIELWSAPNDLVLSPFVGIGSEGFVAVQRGRTFLGIELKQSYYNLAIKNLKEAERGIAKGLFK